MILKAVPVLLPWLALASAVSLTAQQQQQLAYAAASQQQAQQFQPQPQQYQPQPQPQYFVAPSAGHGQFSGQRATLASYQPQPQVAAYQAQPRPIPVSPQQYQQIPQQPARKAPRPVGPQQPLQDGEDYDPNPAYNFSFDVKDDTFTNYQNRKEQREGDKISGSYSVVDSDGFIRTVTYTADPLQGFKAEVVREPTDIVVKLPTPAPSTVGSLRSHPNGAFASQPAPQQQRQPQYVSIPSPAPQLRQRQQEPAPQYVQAVPQQQQQQAYTLARQAQQIQQAQLLQAAYRPSSPKAGAQRVGVPVAGGIIYQPQGQLPQPQYSQ